MGAAWCTTRDRDDCLQNLAGERESSCVWVAVCNLRGSRMLAKRDFAAGEVIFKESPVLALSSVEDPRWLAVLRRELEAIDAERAWQFCLAAHCLTASELPLVRPKGLKPLPAEAAAMITEVKPDASAINEKSARLAAITARHVLRPSQEEHGEDHLAQQRLLTRLEEVAARIAIRGFQMEDRLAFPPTSVGVIFRLAAVVNMCSAGQHTATWEFDRKRQTLVVKAVRKLVTGGELTFDPASRPWLAKSVRSGASCTCTACRSSSARAQPAAIGVGVASDRDFAVVSARSDSRLISTRFAKDGERRGPQASLSPRADGAAETHRSTTPVVVRGRCTSGRRCACSTCRARILGQAQSSPAGGVGVGSDSHFGFNVLLNKRSRHGADRAEIGASTIRSSDAIQKRAGAAMSPEWSSGSAETTASTADSRGSGEEERTSVDVDAHAVRSGPLDDMLRKWSASSATSQGDRQAVASWGRYVSPSRAARA